MADAIRAVAREDIKSAVPACMFTWTGLDLDDSGIPIECVDYPDRTVTITGTFGVGGSLTMQGTNDDLPSSNWLPLTDPQGGAITKTSAAIELISEAPRFIRPLVTAGDGTTSLTVKILCRRTV
jgi:hypothetical protein